MVQKALLGFGRFSPLFFQKSAGSRKYAQDIIYFIVNLFVFWIRLPRMEMSDHHRSPILETNWKKCAVQTFAKTKSSQMDIQNSDSCSGIICGCNVNQESCF